MRMHGIRYLLACITLSASLFGTACQLDETEKANKNVQDANKLIEEAGKLQEEGEAAAADPEKCKKSFDEAVEKYGKAATLTSDASKLKVTKIFGEYLEIKGKQFGKQGDHAKKVQALTCGGGTADPAATLKEIETLGNEIKDLSEKATKIETDNKDQFKK